MVYKRKCSTADDGQAQVMQQQQVHLVEVTIRILESLLKSLYSEYRELRGRCQRILRFRIAKSLNW